MSTTTTASGLQYEDTTVGEGAEAKAGQHVTVHYTGWLYENGVQGRSVNMLVSGGCVVRGSDISQAVLFSSVEVDSFCTINQAVILPQTKIGKNCRLSKVVIDRGCVLPEGTVIGENPEQDAQRFSRTESGVVLVTADMLQKGSVAPAA